jgi:carbonic anhydrase/acetyltransferase-like protein (isoleucine patch superfamily)
LAKKNRVAIYGAGYLGRQVLHHLRSYYSDQTEIMGFIDDVLPTGQDVKDGLGVLSSLPDALGNPDLGPGSTSLVFAIGYSSMTDRGLALKRVRDAGYELFRIIHPAAIMEPGVDLGPGAIVLGGAILDQGVEVGAGCFVDIGVRLGADTIVGANNYFSSGTCTGSRVVIGEDCFFGMNCTITTDVRLGNNLFVNANSLVPRDIGDDVKFVEMRKSKQLPLGAGRGTGDA